LIVNFFCSSKESNQRKLKKKSQKKTSISVFSRLRKAISAQKQSLVKKDYFHKDLSTKSGIVLPYKILHAVLQNLTVKDCLKVEFHLVNKIGIFILKYILLVKKA